MMSSDSVSFIGAIVVILVTLGLTVWVPRMHRTSTRKGKDRIQDLKARADQSRQEQREFQEQLLTELRRHNAAREGQTDILTRVLSSCLGWGKYRVDQLDEVQARVDGWLRHWTFERWHMGLPGIQTQAQFAAAWYAGRNQDHEPVAFAL